MASPDKIEDLIRGIPGARLIGDGAARVSGITCDSRRVGPGDIFAAVPGVNADGAGFIPMAMERGAAAVLGVDPGALPVPVICAADVRLVMGCIGARLLGHPDHRVEVLGVTGTNGKTTITYLLESILTAANLRPGVIGTVNYRFGEMVRPSDNTTPESLDVLRMLGEIERMGATHVAMEVSSHALHQGRVSGIRMRRAIFTNLTQDHLDYHRDLEDYYQAKRRLFTEIITGGRACDRMEDDVAPLAVLNLDNEYGRRLQRELAGAVETVSYGLAEDADVRAEGVEITRDGIEGVLYSPYGRLMIRSPLVGAHNLENILAAAALGLAMGLVPEQVETGIDSCGRVPGRLEPVPNECGITVLVDYAHTPDALAHAVDTCRRLNPRRLITVFGCGGDRDRKKRPIMGRIAVSGSDLAVVTSDNPRTEDPRAIIEEILAGLSDVDARRIEPGAERFGRSYVVEPDRRAAIAIAVARAGADDLILIAGKGHEDYQIIGKEKHHFDDREEAARALKEKRS